jgi:hypothetical protein
MKLQDSKLCVNCESLYEGIASCPYCRSEVFVWLSRALGTALKKDAEPPDYWTLALRERPAARSHVYLSGSAMKFFGDTILRCRSFAEFRNALQRRGREMVRVLTFGMM